MRQLGLAIAIGTLLSGCVMGPDYQRPAVEAPKAFQVAPKDAGETADTLWW